MFNNCRNLKSLNISNESFIISNNINIENMCTDLNAAGNSGWRCAIYCGNGVRTKLLSQDDNHNYISGIDRTRVYFPNQGENASGEIAK